MGIDAEQVLWSELAGRGVSHVRAISDNDIVDLVSRYALWIPLDTFSAAPWIAPFAVRKVRIRTDPRAPGPRRDLWGMPDEDGYFTDDNSLIKPVVQRLNTSSSSPYKGSQVTRGLVCCHLWPSTTTDPLLFSFIPNLAWVPKSLASYTDAHMQGPPHRAHYALRSAARARYEALIPLVGQERVRRAWQALPADLQTNGHDNTNHEVLAGRKISDLATKRVGRMISFLEATLDGTAPLPNRFSKRYHAGVGPRIDRSVWPVQEAVSVEARERLLADLRACIT
ncbi:MAG: hypothetical protein O2815_11410 [Actinomycetota bacterium]|nr:hypothetical protein [Actinomycetota bacterium]